MSARLIDDLPALGWPTYTLGGVMNREDLLQDVYRPRGGSIRQWANLKKSGTHENEYEEADEYARIHNDMLNQEYYSDE